MNNVFGKTLGWSLVTALLVVCSALTGWAGDKKVVAARVEIDAPILTGSLPADALDDVKRVVAESLAEVAGSWFGYLDWRTDAPAAAATFTMRLFQESLGSSKALFLKFEGGITRPTGQPAFLAEINAREFPEPRFPEPCVSRPYIFLNLEIPTHDAGKLKEHLLCHVRRQLENDLFRQELETKWLQWIPIYQKPLVPEASEEILLLPIAWNDLQASRDSKLRAKFESGPAGRRRPGEMSFRPALPLSNGIRCLVDFFLFGNTSWDGESRHWDPAFLDAFGRPDVELTVFMQHYDKFLGNSTPMDPF